MALVDIGVYCVGQYHVTTPIKKYSYFFFGLKKIEPVAAIYILIMG